MMSNAILSFAKQFSFEPVVENADHLGKYDQFVVAGMGGSHLPADILLCGDSSLPIHVWNDYGLPRIGAEDFERMLVIASSYSGNTEETLDAYDAARRMGADIAAIAVGGELLRRAKEDGVPFVTLPDTGIQPRMALGFSALAMLKVMNDTNTMKTLSSLASSLHPEESEESGRALAAELSGSVPVIYASRANQAIAMNWKIKLNETGKIPAFYNTLPEMNHNEMTGFDAVENTRALSSAFHIVCLHDDADHPRIKKRMNVMENVLGKRGLPVMSVDISDPNPWQKFFSALLLADWIAVATAEANGAEPEQVPMVEEFKALMQS